MIDISCNQDVNGEHKLLTEILKRHDNGVVFDIGAKNSKFPSFSNTHKFHLFDPNFIYEPGVDYEGCFINERALNSTDYTVDSYCQNNDISDILFMKIDTDGYDIDVLRGAIDSIKNTKYIQIEYDIFYLIMKQNVSDLYKLLEGMNIYKITPFGLKKVDEIVEDNIYSNYLFTRDNTISYDPYEMNADFFKGVFWESDPKSIEIAYNNQTSPFLTSDTPIDIRMFLMRYFSIYMPHIVTETIKKHNNSV